MRRNRQVVVGVVAAAVFSVAAAVTWASVIGSAHDFSLEGNDWNTTKTACEVCHTAHNAKNPQLIPLWNHTATEASFTMYKSPTLDATMPADGPFTGSSASKACLSCHDGTVAINSFGGVTNGSVFIDSPQYSGTAKLGKDLSDDHPIAFTYDTALANKDGWLWDPANTTVSDLGGKTIQKAMLTGDKMECSSCHDVHRQKGTSGTSQLMLILPAEGSKLCLTCHNK